MARNGKNPRIEVMLSSTAQDLPLHRKEATEAILRSGMHPRIMEALPALTSDAIDASLDMVDEVEIYIGIFGMRYGYIPDDPERNPDRLSITELEYRHALKRGIPILIFIMSELHPRPDANSPESELFHEASAEGRAKLTALKNELMTKRVVAFFESRQDLRAQIIPALHDDKLLAEVQARAEPNNTAEPTASGVRSPLPTPPQFYADPPYNPGSGFIGRSADLQRLDAWAASTDPLLIVEAIGGMGKSAVTWEWVQHQLAQGHRYDGIMWWSFYESGATMAAFVRHALAYITRQSPDTLKGRDLRENFRQLQLELRKGRYLLVLDGLERVLVAYHRWDAAQMRDDMVEETESIIRNRKIHACTDPKDDEVLYSLLSCGSTKALMTSRLLPLALKDPNTDRLRQGVAHVHLNGLNANDALALVRGLDVQVRNEAQFTRFVDGFGGHSLMVKLVAGRVLKFRAAPSDFDRWYAAEGRALQARDFDDDLKSNQTHILHYALDGLDMPARHFLSQIAAFGDAVPYDTLTIFNPFVVSAGRESWSARMRRLIRSRRNRHRKPVPPDPIVAFDQMLADLEERGLLRWQRDKNAYDMHPVVRGTAFGELEGAAKTATFERIRRHFAALPPDDIQNAQDLSALRNSITIYRALLGAEQWDEAAQFFSSQLRDSLKNHLAAYYTIIELLMPLFPNGTDAPPRLKSAALRNSVTGTLANMFTYIGRTEEALALYERALGGWLQQQRTSALTLGLLNYSSALRQSNRLALAQRACDLALALAQASDDREKVVYARMVLLGIYRDTGQWDRVDETYATLLHNPPYKDFWLAELEKNYIDSLIYRGLAHTDALDKVEALARRADDALIQRQIKGLRGEIALNARDFDRAIYWYEAAIELARKAGSGDVAVAVGGRARALAHKGEADRARADLEQGLDPIDAAEVCLLLGQREQAHLYAIDAYKSAWADGPPFVWWWVLTRAEKVLDELKKPHPNLAPYNAERAGTIPHEAAIRQLVADERQRTGQTRPV